MSIYKERKATLFKKAEELSTLCKVPACILLYGSPEGTDEVVSVPEIFPSDETEVRDIIRQYKDTVSNSYKKETDVETFVNDLGKEMDTDKRVPKNVDKYSSWEQKLDKCSQEQLRGILCAVDNKIHEAVKRENKDDRC